MSGGNHRIKRFLRTNENDDTYDQNLWDKPKAVLRDKPIAILPYIRKQDYETSQAEELEKEQNIKSMVSRGRK